MANDNNIQPRNNVVSVRLDDTAIQALDLLVNSGLAQSRSEAAAQLIGIGVQSGGELLQQAKQLAESVQRIKNEMISAIKSKDVAKVKDLLDQDSSLVNTQTETGDTAILMAVYYGANEVKDLLLAKGAELNIYEASAVGETKRVQTILESQPELIHSYSHDGWTPLHLASFFGYTETVRYLLDKQADHQAKSQNGMGNTPLHAALAGRHTDASYLLIEAGANPNIQDSSGWTPLHLAAANGMKPMVELLLSKGADKSLANNKLQSPLDLAIEKGEHYIIDLLQ
jgi:ankyrin repeat protein